MRVLRSSVYSQPGREPLTTVLPDSEVIDTLESIRAHHVPGTLVVHEIFDMPDDTDIVAATAEAARRRDQKAEDEQNMAILYYWTTVVWRRTNPGGMVIMPNPMPLSVEQAAVVFEQLAVHPDYDDYSVVGSTEDGEMIALREGRVVIGQEED